MRQLWSEDLAGKKKRMDTHPDTASLPSGEKSVLNTHDECPVRVATAPEPGFPDGETRTSCRISRLSSDADKSS